MKELVLRKIIYAVITGAWGKCEIWAFVMRLPLARLGLPVPTLIRLSQQIG